MTPRELAADLTTYAQAKLLRNARQIARCVRMLTSEQLWRRPNEQSNSVGNLVLHLTGNARQWLCSHVGGDAFERRRQAEFDERGPLPAEQILAALDAVIRRGCEVLGRLTEHDLADRRTIQGYNVTIQTAIFHVVEHFSWHSGQIVYATKAMRGEDVSLYDTNGHILDDPYPKLP